MKFVGGSFGTARALRAAGTARGRRWRAAHRLPPLAPLSPTNFTGPATSGFKKRAGAERGDPLDPRHQAADSFNEGISIKRSTPYLSPQTVQGTRTTSRGLCRSVLIAASDFAGYTPRRYG